MLRRKFCLCSTILALIILLAASCAIFLLFILPPIVRKQIDEQTRLGFNDSGVLTDATQRWISPDYNFSMNIWTFSVMNPDEVILGHKPILAEKGPYAFREVQHKEVAFADNNTRVFYRNKRYYFFDQAASCDNCSLEDSVTVPNIVLQNILDKIKGNLIERGIFDVILSRTGERVFVTTIVRELLFEGYIDPLISKWCAKLMGPICKAANIPDRIGLFYKKNGTDDGKYEIDTGLRSVQDIGKVYSFNDKNSTTAWYGPYARMINGSDGQIYTPGLDLWNSSRLQIFVGPLCRTIELEYNSEDFYKDVPVYLYKPARSTNNVDHERDLGFCNPNSPIYFNNSYIQQKGCLPAGLMDMSSCLPGNAKIYLSQPHFFNSPPALRKVLVGVRSPNEDVDGTVVGINPTSGVVVFAHQRTQINFGVINGGLLSLKSLRAHIIPVVWLNETASFDSKTRDQLLELYNLRSRAFIGGIVLTTISAMSIIGLVLLVVVRRLHRRSDELNLRLLFNQEDEIETTVEEPLTDSD